MGGDARQVADAITVASQELRGTISYRTPPLNHTGMSIRGCGVGVYSATGVDGDASGAVALSAGSWGGGAVGVAPHPEVIKAPSRVTSAEMAKMEEL